MSWWSGRTVSLEPEGKATQKAKRRKRRASNESSEERLRWWLTLISASSVAAAFVAIQEMVMRGFGPELLGSYVTLTIILSHMVVGALAGAALGGLLRLIRLFGVTDWVGRLSDQGKLLLGFCLGLTPLMAVVALFIVAGYEVRAVSPQLALLPGVLMLTGLGMGVLMVRFRPGAFAQTTLVALPALMLCAMMPLAPAKASGASEVLEKGLFTRMAISSVRGLYDGDADGYPSRLCAHGCDCDDGVGSIHPGAPEITDNGVDEDCDGKDLSSKDIARFGLSTGLADAVRGGGSVRDTAEDEAESWRKPYNILLVIMDTVRADHLGCHGYARATSPNLDALAARSVHFTQARSQGSKTRESMPSLLTGRFFSEVSRIEQKWPHILPENVMLAEMLKGAGYQTWAKASFGYFIPYFGYGQGFDKYDDSIPKEGRVHWLRTSDRVTDRTLEAIDDMRQTPEDPFFVMAHYADPHSGYMHHKESPRFGPNISDLYDEEIFFTDLHLGRLFDGLEARGLMEETIIVVTADHGEGLSKKHDHDHLYHGQTLYDELIHVPLIVHAPFAEARRIDRPVGLIDVVPTLLDSTGLKTDSQLRGFSLVPYLRGEGTFERPPVFSQKGQPQWKELAAMVDWPWKSIWKVRTNRFELYRLDRDPHEVTDLAATQTVRMGEMANHMRAWRASLDPPQVFAYGK